MAESREDPNKEGAEYNERLRDYLAATEAAEAAERAQEKNPKRRGRDSTYTNKKKQQGKLRVNNAMALALILVACIAEVILLLPFPGLNILFDVLFWMWFGALGVSYFNGKQAALKILALFSMIIIGSVPVVSFLPELITGVLLLIAASRIEDTVGDKTQLTRIAKRRIRGRDAIVRRNKRSLEKTQEKTKDKKNGDKKVDRERRRGEQALTKYDRKMMWESAGMVTRAALGTPSQKVDGIVPRGTKQGQYSEAERRRQRAEAGYYVPEGGNEDDYSPDEATEEYQDKERN